MSASSSPQAAPQIHYRSDYQPPAWLVPEISLDFQLDPAKTRVRTRMVVDRAGERRLPFRLEGDGLQPLDVVVDGERDSDMWRMEDGALLIDLEGMRHIVETEVEISPEHNSQLMGLYASGGLLCTQCEPEGFRRITFFPDRPDVLSTYTVRMEADQARFPVLLANGDMVASGRLPDGRHWAEWRDPFPKPSYLFALVAADLAPNRDRFVTASGREVSLAIWVRPEDLPRTRHAMEALKLAMAWDEQVYGREYDLETFNIVAVADFNFGAMENKGLNIFNSRYILADPDTATDQDFDGVAGVVAHEYFHNWSGNRVTCRDWFQLSLKEGFTVFRDQQFTADQGSPAVSRIEDVRMLRAAQFPEDAGPLAHPVRPNSYIEISNFYTATVYNKGAELIRMMHTILGAQRFRAGADLYFNRHDGQAVTCDDFVAAMEDATGEDLEHFRLWYEQAGTPRVTAQLTHEPAGGRANLLLRQTMPATPGNASPRPMQIPLRIALFGELTGERLGEEQLVLLDAEEHEITFDGISERPILSINRGFSAPVIIEAERSADDLAFLAAHDDDPFARYEALQQLMVDTLVKAVTSGTADHDPVIESMRQTLIDPALDAAFKAEALTLPSEAFIGDQLPFVDPDAVARARDALRLEIGGELEVHLRAAYRANAANRYEYAPGAKGARRLRSVALGYLAAGGVEDAADLAFKQFGDADNMTDRYAALAVLANGDAPEREQALAAFYQRHGRDNLTLDKWFSVQALSMRPDTLEQVQSLRNHPDFTLTNPNRVRSLIGAFANNQRAFHDKSGGGYRLLADVIIEVDALNPQMAARLVPPLGRWRRFEASRRDAMRAELRRILAVPGISKDVYEQVSKSLDG